MEGVDQLFPSTQYHTYCTYLQPNSSHPHRPSHPAAHPQHLYNFYQHPSRQPSPHPSQPPSSIPASPHGLFLSHHHSADPTASQEHREPEHPVDQIQDDTPIDEEPLYVNAKQYYRILKRRVARARLEEVHRLSRQRKPYLHESRHKHAMRRPRGPGGRFLTAEEIAAQKANQVAEVGPSASTSQNGDEEEPDHKQEHSSDMIIESPAEQEKSIQLFQSQPPLVESKRDMVRANSALQPLLQPRPQVQIQAQPQGHIQSQPQLQLQLPAQLQRPASQHGQQQPHSQSHPLPHSPHAQSPAQYLPMSSNGSLELLNVGFHAPSHPPTPAPISPHSAAIQQGMQMTEQRAHDHSRHDHSRGVVSHHSVQASVPPPPTSTITLRSPYAAMQMHHVPHPHAHARHHASYLNRAEQLYTDPNNVLRYSAPASSDNARR